MAKVFDPNNTANRMPALNKTPMRAANSFGPALTSFGFNFSNPAIYTETKANGLYFENSAERRKKSRNKKAMI